MTDAEKIAMLVAAGERLFVEASTNSLYHTDTAMEIQGYADAWLPAAEALGACPSNPDAKWPNLYGGIDNSGEIERIRKHLAARNAYKA